MQIKRCSSSSVSNSYNERPRFESLEKSFVVAGVSHSTAQVLNVTENVYVTHRLPESGNFGSSPNHSASLKSIYDRFPGERQKSKK
ncbi:hypothetical protein B0H19DRAFT_1193275 [Mycena capillaripes]|nr:hypothetical protein B0H19DRAFT_1193275 [Mycena capillaripes]